MQRIFPNILNKSQFKSKLDLSLFICNEPTWQSLLDLPGLTSESNKHTGKPDLACPEKDFNPLDLDVMWYTPHTPIRPTQSQCRSWWQRRSWRSSGWWSRCRGWSSTSGTHLGRSFLSLFFWKKWTIQSTQRIGCFRRFSDHYAFLVCFVAIIFCDYYILWLICFVTIMFCDNYIL